MGIHQRLKPGWGAICTALTACALLIGPADAAVAGSRVIVTPADGQVVRTHPVRIKVKAGPEYGDVSARLNGVEVGEDFERKPHNKRVLLASNSHGLRHGENVLRVKAWRKGKLRRATVHFTVAHRRHMAGAGRDRIVPGGAKFKLRGGVRSHPSLDFGGHVRWHVVKAPRGSKLGRGPVARRAAAERKALKARKTLKPTFKPDVLGTYTLEMQAGAGANATRDRLTLSSVPQQPLVPVSTAIPPDTTDPRWGIKLSCADPCGDPDIAGDVFRAPWMRKTADGSSYSGTAAGGYKYEAIWQVVALERTSLKLLWNRTYGWCTPGPPNEPPGEFCRRNDAGEPVFIDAHKELTANGPDGQPPLIIARSHPSLTSVPNGAWGPPNAGGFVNNDPLPALGAPSTDDARFSAEINAAAPGTASFIGAAGMELGEAQVAVIADGRALNGYLAPDQHAPTPNYGFVPQVRVEFDTRVNANATQTIGDQTHTPASVPDGMTGYFVTANDQHSLAHIGSAFFATDGPGVTDSGVTQMTAFLDQLNKDGSLVMITTLVTPAAASNGIRLVNGSVSTALWDGLADQIVALGGTRHRFNLSAVTPGDDYSLLGWTGGEEGEGDESTGKNATLRGTLVPDEQYRFRPIHTTEDGTGSPTRLADLLIQPPSNDWPEYAADPAGGNAALKWLAGQFPQKFGTADPRVAYWAAPIDANTAGDIRDDITKNYNAASDYPAGHGFSAEAFKWAVDQLYLELGWVKTARTYMTGASDDHGVQVSGGLALPTFVAGEQAWKEAKDTSDALLNDLAALKQKAELQANWFDVVEGVLDVILGAAGLPDLKKLEAFVEVSAGLIEEAGVLWEKNWTGGSAADDIAVEADQLGDQLQTRLQSTSATFSQLANVVVSDPVKLAEVGTWGNCKLSVNGCGAFNLETGQQEFAEYYDPTDTSNDLKAAVEIVNRGVEQTIWEELVPLAFGVWDIAAYPQSTNAGKFTAAPTEATIDLNQFSCNRGFGTEFNNPFDGAPRAAWSGSLEHINPLDLSQNQWRIRISTAKSGITYSWLTPDQLQTMFGSVESGGLGIDPHDWMREAEPVFAPASDVFCGWLE